MTLVVDASVVVAALVDDGEVGHWAEAALRHPGLAAPHLMPSEAADVLRGRRCAVTSATTSPASRTPISST